MNRRIGAQVRPDPSALGTGMQTGGGVDLNGRRRVPAKKGMGQGKLHASEKIKKTHGHCATLIWINGSCFGVIFEQKKNPSRSYEISGK